MLPSEFGLIGTMDGPVTWPEPPAEMTVTTLAEIESCPRRWALRAAHYPEIWEGRGYPPRVHLGPLAGSVVHLALETVVKGLVSAGCSSIEDPASFQVVKNLGGYTNVVNDCIDRVLQRFGGNPRAQPLLEFATRSLRARVPEFRARTQTMVSRLHLLPVGVSHGGGSNANERGPLSVGIFSEVELRAKEIQWKGRADLLVLSPVLCAITDFKTGSPDESHEFQIQVYALLWSRDAELNPTRRRADRLILAYSTGDVEVAAPTDSELNELEQQLVARATAAREAVSRHPPEARPGPLNCSYCDVRHLCNEYWTAETQGSIAQGLNNRSLTDVALTITGVHGPSSWDALVECCPIAKRGQRFLLRADKRRLPLRAGQLIRLLSVQVSEPNEENSEFVMIGTMAATSEVFLVS